jgi:hypothetical protein
MVGDGLHPPISKQSASELLTGAGGSLVLDSVAAFQAAQWKPMRTMI